MAPSTSAALSVVSGAPRTPIDRGIFGSFLEHSSPAEPDRVTPTRRDVDLVDGVLRLPAHSITILTVDGAVPDAEPAQPWVRGPGRAWRARQTSTDPNGSRVDFAY